MSKHPDTESHEGFVSRWARRKSSARQGNTSTTESSGEKATADQVLGDALPQTTPRPADSALGAPISDPTSDTTDERAGSTSRDDAPGAPGSKPLPAIESLDERSDYSAFMSPEVGKEIRNLALRKLFRAPMFNIRDGLDDYDEDFTTFEKLGDIVTADMRHHAERKQREQAEREMLAQSEAHNEPAGTVDEDKETTDETVRTDSDQLPNDDANQAPEDISKAAQAQQSLASTTSPNTTPASHQPQNPSTRLAGKLRRHPDQT